MTDDTIPTVEDCPLDTPSATPHVNVGTVGHPVSKVGALAALVAATTPSNDTVMPFGIDSCPDAAWFPEPRHMLVRGREHTGPSKAKRLARKRARLARRITRRNRK